jgi:hypothetical protein
MALRLWSELLEGVSDLIGPALKLVNRRKLRKSVRNLVTGVVTDLDHSTQVLLTKAQLTCSDLRYTSSIPPASRATNQADRLQSRASWPT